MRMFRQIEAFNLGLIDLIGKALIDSLSTW